MTGVHHHTGPIYMTFLKRRKLWNGEQITGCWRLRVGKVWLIKEWHQENFDTKELFCALTVVVVLKFTKNDNYVLHVHFFYKKMLQKQST
jgi:hypothetical protein